MTTDELFEAFRTGREFVLRDHAGRVFWGVIGAIEREDGSGTGWNVRLGGCVLPVFVRTVSGH